SLISQRCYMNPHTSAFKLFPYSTLFRSTHEEIGVAPEFIQLIGTQPGFLTSTRFTMKPIIGLIQPGFTITPDKTEVAEVFEVPRSEEHTSELHHVKISYAVFCLKKKKER